MRAGVKPFGTKAIRHHVASILNDSGKVSMKQVQKLMRHKRQTTTETYLHAIGSDLHEAVEGLDARGKGYVQG
jgi:integrase